MASDNESRIQPQSASVSDATTDDPAGKQGKPGENPITSTPSTPSAALVTVEITPLTPIYPVPIDPDLAAWVATLDDDALELFNERAGIREFEGGVSRQAAESAARDDVLRWLRQRQTPLS